jgi:hypothetical protein
MRRKPNFEAYSSTEPAMEIQRRWVDLGLRYGRFESLDRTESRRARMERYVCRAHEAWEGPGSHAASGGAVTPAPRRETWREEPTGLTLGLLADRPAAAISCDPGNALDLST